MRLQVVSCFIEIGVRINHHWRSIIGCVEDVEITIGVCFQQHTHAIGFAENVIRIDSHRQPVGVTHEQRQSKTKVLSIDRP